MEPPSRFAGRSATSSRATSFSRDTLRQAGVHWLAVDRSSSRFINTPCTLVIDEGEYQTDNAAALRSRRADLKSYPTRGLEVIIVPDKFATPAAPG
ncbi:MAG: hypothetical protein M3R07_06670, partial [Gemmatimonadota bacterium]|nr:hypothetical protein [Gemmatimonadota bacterium]